MLSEINSVTVAMATLKIRVYWTLYNAMHTWVGIVIPDAGCPYGGCLAEAVSHLHPDKSVS